MGRDVVPVEDVLGAATAVGVIAATALIQTKGDPTGAIARLERMQPESVVGVNAGDQEAVTEFNLVDLAQKAINQAGEHIEGGGG